MVIFKWISALTNKNTMQMEDCETETRPELFVILYEEVFPDVALYIKKMGGNLEDTKDVFQDALIIYYEKTRSGDLFIQVNEQAYLFGICKHLWLKKQKQDARHYKLDAVNMLNIREEPCVSSTILNFVAHAGKKCLELLQSFYFEKRNMNEIAEQFKFSNEHSAIAQKYKCLEKIRAVIKNKSLKKEDFYE
jgi:DNA-directed RNA polymerase specialized sigma24 family protein